VRIKPPSRRTNRPLFIRGLGRDIWELASGVAPTEHTITFDDVIYEFEIAICYFTDHPTGDAHDD
jgi:hypothetical protein